MGAPSTAALRFLAIAVVIGLPNGGIGRQLFAASATSGGTPAPAAYLDPICQADLGDER